MIHPRNADGSLMTIREQLERRASKKAKRAAKAATLWPKKVNRPKSLSTAKLEAFLWDAFSFYIRMRDKLANNGLCFYCEKRPIECAMHRIKRGKRETKYHELNVDGGCHWCNDKDRFWPQEFDAIFIRKKGADIFLDLDKLSRVECHRSRADILEKTVYYRAKTQELLLRRGLS